MPKGRFGIGALLGLMGGLALLSAGWAVGSFAQERIPVARSRARPAIMFAIWPENLRLQDSQYAAGVIGPPAEAENCALNPRVYLLPVGARKSARSGDYVFRRERGQPGRVIAGVLLPPSPDNATRAHRQAAGLFLIIDDVSLDGRTPRGAFGQIERVFAISTHGRNVHFSARDVQFSACPDPGRSVSRELIRQAIAGADEAPALVTRINRTGPNLAIYGFRDTWPVPTSYLRALEALNSSETLVGSDVFVGSVSGPASAQWRLTYTSAGGASDVCSPMRGSLNILRCSDGTRIRIEDVFTSGWRLPILNRQRSEFIRMSVDSAPDGASIYFGPVRHNATTRAYMDVRREEIRTMHLERRGFGSCPYGERWRIDFVRTPRQIMNAFCALRARPAARR